MALGPNNQPPVRYPEGLAFANKYDALANMGVPSPVFWHQWSDDEMIELGVTGQYTKSATTTGTAVATAGDGGLGLFSTAAANNDAISVQLPVATFVLPPNTSGKRLFWGARLQLLDVTASAFVAGLINTTATPFTGGSITDGAYFQKSAGGTVLNFITANASTLTTTAVPTASYSLANATNIDLCFAVNYKGEFEAYVGANLFGWQPQSGTGSSVPTRGMCLRLSNVITTAALNMTLGVQAGAAAIKTMTVDFHFAAKER